MDGYEARDALDSLASTQARMADDLSHCPPWRHAAFGALFVLIIGSVSISAPVQFAALPFILIGVALLMRSDRKRMGVFVNGYRRGATLPLTLAFVAVMLVEVFFAMKFRRWGYPLPAKAGLAGAAFVIAVGFSLYWQYIYELELRAGVGRTRP